MSTVRLSNGLKLSAAQLAFLRDLARAGESRRPGGYRDSGREASAWNRTAESLAAKGLVTGRRHCSYGNGGHMKRGKFPPLCAGDCSGSFTSVRLVLPAPALD